MTETSNLSLPLVQPSQAQKHVTVNEALVRLDGMGQLVLVSRTAPVPPLDAPDGQTYGVPAGAVNDWGGHDGEVAIASNGGWVFALPQAGWRGWIADEGQLAIHDGRDWIAGGLAVSPGFANTRFEIIEADHVIAAGASSTTTVLIPQYALVLGVTGRITTTFTGTLTSWRLGVSGGLDRYGSGLGLVQDAWVQGLSGSPQVYYSATPLELTADGGDFAGGQIRLALHVLMLTPPDVAV